MAHDVFICHASEDKDVLVRPLAEALRERNFDVWYDEFSLRIGDSLRQSIDRGLKAARYGIVVFSPAFFEKAWTQYELDGLHTKMMSERRALILPIWHGVGPRDVEAYSPSLAGTVALQSNKGVEALCSEIARVLRPAGSPLEVAKQELERFGWDAPPVSDEWWITIIGLEADVKSPVGHRHWLFPHPPVGDPDSRGNAIAWTALQNCWNWEAEERTLCQITHPDEIHAFMAEDAALTEAAEAHPDMLANYAPQLLVPEFSGAFGELFDELLEASRREIAEEPDSRFPDAWCTKALALRAPACGGHQPADVADKWMNGDGGSCSAAILSGTDYVVWLLSDHSLWLPPDVRETLTVGMADYGGWLADLSFGRCHWKGELWGALLDRQRPPSRSNRAAFKWTRTRRRELEEAMASSLAHMKLEGAPARLAQAFIDRDIVGAFDRMVVSRRAR
jgi:hypothetical protein